ncbi:GNAT family N-acetyltransferase [Pedococcus aerophilus]|uniref:GNAT family N-acetyltransferase n=1 Tax=Pedococcus aerophilus TaxID=436356 RepID=A0ABN3UWP3_9MICO
MTRLVTPHVRHQDSYLAASDEFLASREQRDGDGDWVQEPEPGYDGFTFTRVGLQDPDEFARFVDQRRRAADPDEPRRRAWPPVTFTWMVVGGEYVGSLAIRHRLTDRLLEEGGHIGYSVRPTARRRGHATRALDRALVLAHGVIDSPSVLVTCLEENTGSRAVIEANGGEYEDSRGGVRRYWIPTRPS